MYSHSFTFTVLFSELPNQSFENSFPEDLDTKNLSVIRAYTKYIPFKFFFRTTKDY